MSNFVAGVKEKYPRELLEGRVEIEGKVIGCLLKDPFILNDCSLRKDHFITKEGRFFFGLVSTLNKKRLSTLDEISISTSISEEAWERLNEYGGMQAIEDMTSIINIDNWESYLDDFYRENALRKMCDNNFDLTKPMVYAGKKTVPIKMLRKMNCEQTVDFFDSLSAELEEGQSSAILEEEVVKFDDEFLDALQEGVENGIPFETAFENVKGKTIRVFPNLSRRICGFLPGYLHMMGGYSSVGKSTWWIGILMSMISTGHRVLVISNEEKVGKFKTKCFCWLLSEYANHWGMTKKKLISGNGADGYDQAKRKVQEFWDSEIGDALKYVHIRDADMKVVSRKIREECLKKGYDVVLYDTFKIQGSDMKDARQDLALVRDSRILHDLAQKYDLVMLASIQLAERMSSRLWLDSSCLSNSKQIKEQLENLILMRNVSDEELDPSSRIYIRPFNLVKTDDGWEEQEVYVDPRYTYRAVFLEKARSGGNSNDTHVAYLMKFDGDHSVFHEFCMCRPRHGEFK